MTRPKKAYRVRMSADRWSDQWVYHAEECPGCSRAAYHWFAENTVGNWE